MTLRLPDDPVPSPLPRGRRACGGDVKPAKHPYLVHESALLLLTKIDLLPYVSFDLKLFRRDIRELNSDVELLEVSATTGIDLDLWLRWLEQNLHHRAELMRQ